MTPSGDVMRVTDTDIKWFNHFYTFKVQGKKCYQSIGTIAKVMGRARSVAQERINNLESLGLLTVGKEAFNEGWRNTYTCTPIDDIVSCMPEEVRKWFLERYEHYCKQALSEGVPEAH